MAWKITRVTSSEDREWLGAGNGDQSKPMPYEFRLLDDDDNVYAHGVSSSCDDNAAFAPLDDLGEGNWGCTAIEYKQASGAWERL